MMRKGYDVITGERTRWKGWKKSGLCKSFKK